MTAFEQVLALLPRLSPSERKQVLETLEADAQLADQRAINQAAIAHLDARIAAEDDDDDSWWEAFKEAIDNDRLSDHPLYPDHLTTAT